MISERHTQIAVFVGGILTGLVMFGLIATIVNSSSIVDWAYEHEALAAGLLAIFAAAMTTLILVWQIRQRYLIREDEKRRKFLSASNVMPLIFSEISRYFIQSATTAVKIQKEEPGEYELQELPDGTISAIRASMEFADPQVSRLLYSYCSKIQVQRSRLTSKIEWFNEGRVTTNSVLTDPDFEICIELYFKSLHFLKFYRLEDGAIGHDMPVPKNRILQFFEHYLNEEVEYTDQELEWFVKNLVDSNAFDDINPATLPA